jgi:hypothetical protein
LYVGYGNYRIIEDFVGTNPSYSKNAMGFNKEFYQQILYASKRKAFEGSVFFSITDLDFSNSLTYRDWHYQYYDEEAWEVTTCYQVKYDNCQLIKQLMKEME